MTDSRVVALNVPVGVMKRLLADAFAAGAMHGKTDDLRSDAENYALDLIAPGIRETERMLNPAEPDDRRS